MMNAPAAEQVVRALAGALDALFSLASPLMRVPIRSLLAGTAAAAVLTYAAAGHSLPQMASHEGMAGSTIGLCLLLVTVVARIATPRPKGPAPPVGALFLSAPAAVPALPPLDSRSRASPSTLQRFRN